MMARERLPDRRGHELFDFRAWRFRFAAGVGRFEDGRLGKILINASNKLGTPVDVNARDAAIVASLALQHGTPPDESAR
jgi:hypothetical protein